MEQILSENQVADLLLIKRTTLARMRKAGTGPRYIRVGTKMVRYRPEDVTEWINRNRTDAAEQRAAV